MMLLKKYRRMAALFLPGFLLAGLLCSCVRQTGEKTEHPAPPNIIILLSDELQFEDIGCLGGNLPTPNIDALAGEGLLFTNAYSVAPMCTPSRYALLSGRYPGRCTYPKFLAENPVSEPYCIGWDTFVDSTLLTIPRLLSQHGYATGMAGKWHLGEEGFAAGLLAGAGPPGDPATDEKLRQYQKLVSEKVRRDAGFDVANSVAYGNFDGFPVEALRYHNFPWITKGAVDFMEEQARKGQPFFLYLASTAIHGPHHTAGLGRDFTYTPGGKDGGVLDYQLDVERLQAAIDSMASPRSHRYAGMAFLDHQVGVILEKLKELNIEENTVVIFLPDHNTEPAKATCYEKGLRIPLIIRWPGRILPASKTGAIAQNIDLFPTIMEMAGVEMPENAHIDGLSLLPAIEGKRAGGKEYVFAESGYTRSVCDGQYKYIAFRYPETLTEQMRNGALGYAPNYLGKEKQGQSIIAARFYPSYFDADQLFNLEEDPYEQHNLAYDPKYSAKLAEMQEILKRHLETFGHPFALPDTAFMRTRQFDHLAQKTKSLDPQDIEWYRRDWGRIVWPPEGEGRKGGRNEGMRE